MFNFVFALIELIGIIGVVRACVLVHGYCLNHKWLKHTTEVGAWTMALGYGGIVLVLFWLAHLSSSSIYLVMAGLVGGISHVLLYGLFFLIAVIVVHVLWGMFFVIPYLARGLAAFSSRK